MNTVESQLSSKFKYLSTNSSPNTKNPKVALANLDKLLGHTFISNQ